MAKKQSCLRQLLEFVERQGTEALELADEQVVFDLDLSAGLECRKAGIDKLIVHTSSHPAYVAFTPGTNLAYSRECNTSIVVLGGPPVPYKEPPRDRMFLESSEEWMLWIRAACKATDRPELIPKGSAKRAPLLSAIDRLKKELCQHLLAARDLARDTEDEPNGPKLLPRPLKKDLAKATGLTGPYVTKCFQHEAGAELRVMWDAAKDIYAILRWVPPRGGQRTS
jgi:hypothetical protein